MSVIANNIVAGAAGQGGTDAYQIDRSVRLNSADSAHFSRTPSSAGNRKTFTFSCWVKRVKDDASPVNLFAAASNRFRIAFGVGSTAYLQVYDYNGSSFNFNKGSAASFRDFSAWYHVVVAIDTTDSTADDRVKMYVNGSRITDLYTGTNINPSQNLDTHVNSTSNAHYIGYLGDNTNYLDAYLADVHFIDGQALDPTDFGEYDDNNVWQPKVFVASGPNDGTTWSTSTYLSSTTNYSTYSVSNGFDGDPESQWLQNTQGGTVTFSNISIPYSSSVKIKVGGSGATVSVNGGAGQSIGANSWVSVASGSGTLTSLAWSANGSEYPALYGIEIDGVLLIDGNTSNIGVNGFHLDFSDNSSNAALGDDSSGNNNDWTVNNLSVASGAGNDSLIDTPTNYESAVGNNGGNYATLNPLDKSSSLTLSNGNLEADTTGGWDSVRATFGMSSGKWYWETQNKQTAGALIGIALSTAAHGALGTAADGAWTWAGANVYINGTASGTGLSNHSSTDIVQYALDVDAGKLWFGRNGTWYDSSWGTTGNPSTGANPTVSGLSTTSTYFAAAALIGAGAIYNFGARSFSYTPPTGYLSLCTQNLPDPTIADGSDYFEAKLYTTETTISGLSFSPDWVWLKRRSQSADHGLYDTVRGVNKLLYSNATNAEETSGGVSAFNSDGFDLGTNGLFTGGGHSFVAWAWDAGTSTVTNTDGSITSSVRANQSAGFSIVSYTGNNTTSTVGHGLNATPGLVIVKSRSAASLTGWMTKHSSLSSNYNLALNLTDAAWNPAVNGFVGDLTSSTTFSLVNGSTNGNNVNQNGVTYIAYCFAPVEGYSAFGSYTGNGSSDGPFVYTGFRPRYLLTKASSAAGTWIVRDTERDEFNSTTSAKLAPNYSYEENNSSFIGLASQTLADFLSNGFKVRSTGGISNDSGVTYVWAAFAEHPFKTARAR